MGVRHPKRLRGAAQLGGRLADLVELDDLAGGGVVTEVDELELDASVAAAAADVRRRRTGDECGGREGLASYVRCPGCGGLVLAERPCVLCQVRVSSSELRAAS